MKKKFEFEEFRLYAIFAFMFTSIIYIGIFAFFIPSPEIQHSDFFSFFRTIIVSIIFNLIRYRYFNTIKFKSDLMFLFLGYFDLFYLNYYFNIHTLDQGGRIVIMFLLIITCIYRGRKMGVTLTLLWFPIKLLSNFIFIRYIIIDVKTDFDTMLAYSYLMDSIYFEITLLIFVFITDAIYREFIDKEEEIERLFNKLKRKYEELNSANNEIEAKNVILNKANSELENVNKKLTDSVAEFFTLQQISNAIGSILNMDELMKYVNDITLGVMGVKSSTIILINEKNSSLEVHTTNITDEADYLALCRNINDNALVKILEIGDIVYDNDVTKEKFAFTADRDVKSLICAPILSKLKKFGLILLEQNFKNAFNEDKIRLLSVITQQVGMAMENADLYNQMHKLAITDNLTGAYNKMYFQKKLEEELVNAKDKNYEVSVVMLDIDYFKKFNDTYGHLFGDMVLRHISNIINESIRSNDTMARFGGEEFIILLPYTKLSQAYEIAENLRKTISITNINKDNISVSVTVSIGVSNFPQNSSNTLELVRNADDALYDAKSSGRNCVKIYSR